MPNTPYETLLTTLQELVFLKQIKQKMEAGTATPQEEFQYLQGKEPAWADAIRSVAEVPKRQPFITLTPQQLADLCTFSFGMSCDAPEDAMEIGIAYFHDHEEGAGWYVWCTEYPEEGSIPLAEATKGLPVTWKKNAERYAKLRRWMSSNVTEGWREVEKLAAVACYMDWDTFDAMLDELPECNVGLCHKPTSE